MIGAGFMLAHQVASKAVRDAVFLSALPVTDLPKMVMTAALLSVAAVPLYSRAMAWLGPKWLVPIGFSVSAAGHLVEWAIQDRGPTVAIVIYLHVVAFGALLLSGFWSLASELFDAHTAKRQFARIAGAGTLGGILGGLAIERIAAWSSAESALLALAMFHAGCAVLAVVLGQTIVGSRSSTVTEPLHLKQLVQASPYVRDIAALVVLGTASAAIVDYLLKSTAAAQLGDGAHLLQFFALFYTGTQVVAFALQTSVLARSQARMGVGRAVSSLPLGLGAGSMIALLFPSLAAFTLARGVEYVLRGSVFRSGYELLFAPMSPGERRKVKAFLDVTCDRTGDAIGAGIVQLLLLTGSMFLVSELLGITILMAAVSIWIGERLDNRYLRAVERRLMDHADDDLDGGTTFGSATLYSGELPSLQAPPVSMPTPRVSPTGSLVVSSDGLIETLQHLRSGNRERVLDALAGAARFDTIHVVQVVRLLAWDDVTTAARMALERTADRHVGLLIDFLVDGATDFAIRRRIPRILITVPSQRAFDGLLAGLADTRFEVRYQCSRAMDRVLIAEPTLRVDADRIFAIVERELSVARPVWNGHRLLDHLESADALMFLDEHLRDRANRSLEHVFSLLVTVLPREPLKVAFRAIHSEEAMLRGLAFEYLHGVLPPAVRSRLWELVGPGESSRLPVGTPEEARDALLRSQDTLLSELTRAAATPSAADARGRSGLPPTARPPSGRR
jgi:AAA family ATP:ADP antiporter